MKRRKHAALVAAALIAALSLAGCSGSATAISPTVSETMQETILDAANQAAAGDTAAALLTLETLQTQLYTSTDAGEISTGRAARIQQAIDLVRSDLQPTPAVPAPEPSVVEAPTDGTEPATTVFPEAPTVPDVTDNDSGKNGKGNGKAQGKNK